MEQRKWKDCENAEGWEYCETEEELIWRFKATRGLGLGHLWTIKKNSKPPKRSQFGVDLLTGRTKSQ